MPSTAAALNKSVVNVILSKYALNGNISLIVVLKMVK